MSRHITELDSEIIKLQDFNAQLNNDTYILNEYKKLCNSNASNTFFFFKWLVSLKREKNKVLKTKGLVYDGPFGSGKDGYLSKEPINAYFDNAIVKKEFDPKTNKIVLTIYLTSKDYKSMRSKDVTITIIDTRNHKKQNT